MRKWLDDGHRGCTLLPRLSRDTTGEMERLISLEWNQIVSPYRQRRATSCSENDNRLRVRSGSDCIPNLSSSWLMRPVRGYASPNSGLGTRRLKTRCNGPDPTRCWCTVVYNLEYLLRILINEEEEHAIKLRRCSRKPWRTYRTMSSLCGNLEIGRRAYGASRSLSKIYTSVTVTLPSRDGKP